MKKDARYDVSGLAEAQFEPGSDERVLRNRLGIKSPMEMDVAEARALETAMVGFVGEFDEKHRFIAADIREIHRRRLGGIYEWAGEYRQVNVSKREFPFAAAARVPDLMAEFETDVLSRLTPCNFNDRAAIARALGVKAREVGAGLMSAQLLPGARIVRGFNAIGAARMGAAWQEPGKVGMPIAGDDAQAIAIASNLVRDIGYEPVLIGGLAMGRHLQPREPLAGERSADEIRKIAAGLK